MPLNKQANEQTQHVEKATEVSTWPCESCCGSAVVTD